MKNRLSVLAALAALIVLIAASPQVIDSCRYGLSLCTELILPSLFPFFVVSILLSRLGFPALLGRLLAGPASRLFRVSGAGVSALLIGLTGGYPLGAAYIAELEKSGSISTAEASHLLAFCNNSGPAFIVGAVGAGVFGSARIGLLLYAVHLLAALLTGLLLRPLAPGSHGEAPAPLRSGVGLAQALPEAVRQAVVSLLNVCGFVVCFTVFTGLLEANGFLDALSALFVRIRGMDEGRLRAALTGFCELGGGIGALRGLPADPRTLALAAAMLGWGGVSVHFQTLALIADQKIKSAPHFAGRLCSAGFSYVLAFLLFRGI